MKRGAGVLLNISSLQGDYAIGGFGDEVLKFADHIKSMGFHYWQVLPMTKIGFNNSPYSSESAFAGNCLYVSPDMMFKDGYISGEDLQECKYYNQRYSVDYQAARIVKRRMFEIAYKNFSKMDELKTFLEKEKYWLDGYAKYMAIKEAHELKPWWEWPKGLKACKADVVKAFIDKHEDRYYFYVFTQYMFQKQWDIMRKEIKKRDVKIIGDTPIYVALDSADVWNNQGEFLLDKNGRPKSVAGVPPDYFSATGQVWGNPLYNFNKMKKNDYAWWLDRVQRMFDLYDIVRIDHFRAFDRFLAIPYGETTAVNGKWKKGPGMDLISKINAKFSKDRIIAEDLGTIDDGVRELLKESGYFGMRVLQFAFDDYESTHLPHNYPLNTVAYTATHDNNTTLGWLYATSEETRKYIFDYLEIDWNTWGEGGYYSKSVKTAIKAVIRSSALLAVIPYQDLCGYGADTRMNIPGVCDGNWAFRMTQEAYDNIQKDYYLHLNNIYGRNNFFGETK